MPLCGIYAIICLMSNIRSIDDCITLQEITNNREHEYNVHIANKDDYEGVLVDIYEKPTHFVYELLQNADDALATKVRFELGDSELRFYHNGSKDFSLDDIKSITGVNNSTKKNTKNVGKFGVGFKSVFSITETPYIYNRNISFRIEHMIIPYEEDPVQFDGFTTMFRLPFKSKKYTNEKIVEKILREFTNLDCATIMFLHNITTLELPDNEINITREKLDNYEIIQDIASGNQFYNFKDADTNVSIAYKVEDDKIRPCNNVYVYSFLPTKVKSNLPFYVDAPFELATTREAIDFDNVKNQNILENIRSLFKKTLVAFRDEKYIDGEFICALLPLDKDDCDSEIYACLYNSLADIFTSEKLLPTTDNEYTLPNDVVICNDWLMVELSNRYKKKWLNIKNMPKDVRDFFVNKLGIEEVNVVNFAQYIADNLLLKNKNNDWLMKFYLLCSRCGRFQYDELKQIPIIKTRTGDFKSAYINGGEQVFRPSNGLDNSTIINYLFLNDKIDDTYKNGMQELLRILGIKERTPRQMIEMTIMPNWDEATDQEKIDLFNNICAIYNKSNDSNKTDIVNYLKGKEIFKCVDLDGKIYWTSGSQVMQGNPEQRLLFKNALFLEKNLWKEEINIDEKTGKEMLSGTAPLCQALGVMTSLPVKISKSDYYNDDPLSKSECEEYGIPIDIYPRWWVSEKHYIEGFQEIINDISSEEETKALIKLLSKLASDELKDKISGTYDGNAYRPYINLSIPSDFMRCLKNTEWIVRNGQKLKPYELTINDFIDAYGLNGNEDFLQLLGLSDPVKNLPSKEMRGAKLTRDCTEEEIKKLEEYKRKMREHKSDDCIDNEENNEAISENDILDKFPALSEELNEEPIMLDSAMTEEEIFGNDTSGIIHQQQAEKNTEYPTIATTTKSNQKFNKALGDYGEKRGKDILEKKYRNGEEINWYGGTNKGYDFSISLDGEDIHFIDVKTTTNKKKILVTPSEWNMAKNKKEKYSILVIDANSGKYSFINNPYQLYMDNKINIEVQAIILG